MGRDIVMWCNVGLMCGCGFVCLYRVWGFAIVECCWFYGWWCLGSLTSCFVVGSSWNLWLSCLEGEFDLFLGLSGFSFVLVPCCSPSELLLQLRSLGYTSFYGLLECAVYWLWGWLLLCIWLQLFWTDVPLGQSLRDSSTCVYGGQFALLWEILYNRHIQGWWQWSLGHMVKNSEDSRSWGWGQVIS